MSRILDALKKLQADSQGRTGGSAPSLPRNEQDSPQHIEAMFRKPRISDVLAENIIEVSEEHLQEQRVIASSTHDERVGPYRQLRTQILKTMRDNHWTTIAVTSPNEGAGKSLTAANLAISLSRDVRTNVLLVDLDLMTPTIHKKLDLSPEMGVVDFLEGEADLAEIVFTTGFDRLSVLVSRPAGKYSSELLASPKMQDLMKGLSQQKDGNLTIFDLPPLLRNDDAIMFTPSVDATLVVVEDGVTTEDQLKQSIRLLAQANVIGTILNKARN